jgi:hypothetical protein
MVTASIPRRTNWNASPMVGPSIEHLNTEGDRPLLVVPDRADRSLLVVLDRAV